MKSVEKFKIILTNKNYSERTRSTYAHYLEKFLVSLNKNPYHVTTKEIEKYLFEFNYSSVSQQNQIIGTLKLFAKYVLGKKDIHLSKIERPRKEKRLPRVIDAEQLAKKIKGIKNLKHKSILTLGLSCGLRVSEVINLKWEHLDRERNLLKVVDGKGKKDRHTILNDSAIGLLENYWRKFRTKDYVFEGQFKEQYSATSIQRIIKKYIHPKASFHILRHSFATYAVDNGTGLAPLAGAMGHSSTKTTEIYFHLSAQSLKTIKQAI